MCNGSDMLPVIRTAEAGDLGILVALGLLLWPDNTEAGLYEEFADALQDCLACFFLLYCNEEPAGFAQVQLRQDYVEGTHTSPVGYLEGIFVKEEYRRRGYAGMLVQVCEDWASKQGCREFASDCPISNTVSYAFHIHMGFAEANRIICFTKKLTEKMKKSEKTFQKSIDKQNPLCYNIIR